ncbi:MAG TPA: ribonuclease P protein component [Candidatus Paceibacterota bacterium]|jgi:ribonuclease P protein component|nr:ribonuclease P protein component [Candidatus Paceibacterota bacterium]
MLPSNQRLSRQQLTDLLKNPEIKVIFNHLGTLKYLHQSNSEIPNKLSVVTGSKNQKKAVLRNKIRRQIYIIFRNNAYNINISGIFYASKQAYSLSYQEIKDYFYALLSKIDKKNS